MEDLERRCASTTLSPAAQGTRCARVRMSVCLSFFLMVEKAWRPDLKGQELTCASYSGRKRK